MSWRNTRKFATLTLASICLSVTGADFDSLKEHYVYESAPLQEDQIENIRGALYITPSFPEGMRLPLHAKGEVFDGKRSRANVTVESFEHGLVRLKAKGLPPSVGNVVFIVEKPVADWNEIKNGLSEKYLISKELDVIQLEGGYIHLMERELGLHTGDIGVIHRASIGREPVATVELEGGAVGGRMVLRRTDGGDSSEVQQGDWLFIGELTLDARLNSKFYGWAAVGDPILYTGRLEVAVDLYQKSNVMWTVYSPFESEPVINTELTWQAKSREKELITEVGTFRLGDNGKLVFYNKNAVAAILEKESAPAGKELTDPWKGRVWPKLSGWRKMEEEPTDGFVSSRDSVSGLTVRKTGNGIGLFNIRGNIVRTYRVDGEIGDLVFPPGRDWIALWQKSTGWRKFNLKNEIFEDATELSRWSDPPYCKSPSVVSGTDGRFKINFQGERDYPEDGGASTVRSWLSVTGRPDGKIYRVDNVPPEWRYVEPVALRLNIPDGQLYAQVSRNGILEWWCTDVSWSENLPSLAEFHLPSEAPLLIRDAYNDNASNWLTFREMSESAVISNSRLEIWSKETGGMALSSLPWCYDGDFSCTVKAEKLSGTNDNEFGIVLLSSQRSEQGNHVRFSVSNDGHWRVVTYTDGLESGDWVDSEENDRVLTPGDKSVSLKVTRFGGELAFSINGKEVKKEIPDVMGDVFPGLFAVAWDNSGVKIGFDDFELKTGR